MLSKPIRNLILLLILFLFIDITGSWIPVYFMNPDHASVPLTISSVFLTIGFRLFFALWYWIAIYSVWMLANIGIFLIFPRSVMRSVAVSSVIPLFVICTVPDAVPVVIWYCLLSIAFGFMFHKYADTTAPVNGM
ncbi:hypothetical protein FEM33_16855 [Dyadobacter flavalbus]|uniref:Uncharacterized protein n=1 Tax=Dyadobacter flavalbus TaxID=2579942 RepID=A0A5M8QVB8_9BACT|nr:hypothetical protein [Dyadobacter flavalbus]KAA6438363.1 hypothetical protein FEM33_16855 [Dyadobacter flavalbus]